MQGKLPVQNTHTLNQIWQQTPQLEQKTSQMGFITESPFSFKNPIFFSVPRDNGNKNIKLLKSKRQLFSKTKVSKQRKEEDEPKKFPPFQQKPQPTEDQSNDFLAFVSQQEKTSAVNQPSQN